MLDQRPSTKSTKDLLEEIEVAHAAERLRRAAAEAETAECRARNLSERERAETGAVRHRIAQRWVVAGALSVALILGHHSAASLVPLDAALGGTNQVAVPAATDRTNAEGEKGAKKRALRTADGSDLGLSFSGDLVGQRRDHPDLRLQRLRDPQQR